MRVVNMKYNNPVNGVNVGRPTIWGNDWSNLSWGQGVHKNLPSAKEAVFHYTDWLINGVDDRAEDLRRQLFAGALVGKTLKCWCVPCQGLGGDLRPGGFRYDRRPDRSLLATQAGGAS